MIHSGVLLCSYIFSVFREIMSLSNALIYNNRLLCGSAEVASGRLHLPHLPPHHPPPPLLTGSDGSRGTDDDGVCWMERAIDPDSPVVFLNTDKCSGATETIIGDHICNEFEANLVWELIQNMIRVS